MDPAISKLVEEISEKPPRSKLEAHAEVIAALRRKRRPYREIAQFLQEHLAISVAPSTIHDFVRVRRRRGKRNTVARDEPNTNNPKPARAISETDDDVQRIISAVKRRTPADGPKPVFAYDENEPLTLRRKPKSDDTD